MVRLIILLVVIFSVGTNNVYAEKHRTINNNSIKESNVVLPGDGTGNGPGLKYDSDDNEPIFIDLNTKLVWEKKDSSDGVHNINNKYNWSTTSSGEPNGTLFTEFLYTLNRTCDGDEKTVCVSDIHCKGIGENEVCGHFGIRHWCIPNVKILHSLVDNSVSHPSSQLPGEDIDGMYWSSTDISADSALGISFGIGRVIKIEKKNGTLARAVYPCYPRWTGYVYENEIRTIGTSNPIETFKFPSDLIISDDGNVYISDTGNNRILVLNKDGTLNRQIASGELGNQQGTGLSNKFNKPEGLVIDGNGNLFIADTGNHQILKCDTSDNCIVFAGAGSAGFQNGSSSSFNEPTSLTFDNTGNLYIADKNNHIIRVCDSMGNCSTAVGLPGTPGYLDGTKENAKFKSPSGIAFTNYGTLLIIERHNNFLREFDPISGKVGTLAPHAEPNNTFSSPRRVHVGEKDLIFISDAANARVVILGSDGKFLGQIESGDQIGALGQTVGIETDGDLVYFVDHSGDRILTVKMNNY